MEPSRMNTIAQPVEYLLSGISSTSAIITRFIRSVRVAHADLAAVTRDLSDLRLLLELIRDEPGIPLVLQAQPLEPWLEHPPDFRESAPQQHSRVASFGSSGSGRSSSGSIQRSMFNMSPVSAHDSGSASPIAGPVPFPPFPSSPPPEYRRTWINPPTSAAAFPVPVPSRQTPHETQIQITPKRHLTDKSKASEVLHIDISPSASYVATKHSNKIIKIWSIPRNALHGTIKITSYVQPRVRSREYFIRSHAILSENSTLIGITTHFGLTLEIYNFAKGGTGAKKVQVIEEAHRWAASQRDAFHDDYAGLAVYRPKLDRIDRFFLVRHPSAKTPFREDPNHSIELLKAGLPFLPKFPELAYSTDSPFLIAAAGPRPGDPPRPNSTILIAWQVKPVSDSKLSSQTPDLPDEERHKPYRVCVPNYPALQTALPACLASHGSTAVSIWIPASTPPSSSSSPPPPPPPAPAASSTSSPDPTPSPFAPSRPKPPHHRPHASLSTPPSAPLPPQPQRLVLTWHLPTNTTRLLAIPAGAQACVSPDCRRLAYSDAAAGQFVVVDLAAGAEVWRWPDAARAEGFASFGQLENLRGVTVFEFSSDGGMLVVGDVHGAVGVYEIGEVGGRVELGVGTEVAWADVLEQRAGFI
ncbi:cd00922f-7f8b-44d4-881b-5f29f4469b22 [Thermothielavioides terrestris]|uniref:Cd00922f-7f8b-44d4-881b-5f29f4469b22 n=1 Tax=Thermothielavioides terrestris TaxID=2587410 RepID=A0A446BPW3_9PEZI|nr:cd00922f-7f8b-44d4-881b-5f29f4469b22 [Thermothielavioides terrestris]